MLLYSFLSRYPTISGLPPTLDKRRLLQAKWQACLEGHTGTTSQPTMLSSFDRARNERYLWSERETHNQQPVQDQTDPVSDSGWTFFTQAG